MSEVEEAWVESLEIFIGRVRNGEINLQTVGSSVAHDFMLMERSYHSIQLSIVYSEVPKKTYKTQQEIYAELFDEKYEFYKECKGYSEKDSEIIANIYASSCTVDAWRDQYE